MAHQWEESLDRSGALKSCEIVHRISCLYRIPPIAWLTVVEHRRVKTTNNPYTHKMDETKPIYGPFFGVMGAASAMIFSGK